ncbi:MAG: hypothetical protein HY298_19385 [Verrucomicrobia bacterium]|nr:hypothetical protein [Verrucomicrobiota bacterium]
MRSKSNLSHFFAVAVAAFTMVPLAQAELVYDNSVNDQSTRFNPGTIEVGDEIALAGTGRIITDFTFQYWGTNFTGGENARVRFYANDGTASPSGALMPGTLLFDSGPFIIADTARSTLTFTDFSLLGGNLTPLTGPLPDNFTWSVQFSLLAPGATAGVDLYSPQAVGDSFDDYWDHTTAGPTGWTLRTNNTAPFTPYDFAARINAVPEPTTLWLAIFGGLALLGIRLHYSRS